MSLKPNLRIDLIVSELERAAAISAARQLHERLSIASGAETPITLTFHKPGSSPELTPGSVILASLLPDVVDHNDSAVSTSQRWREELTRLARITDAPVLLFTVFRHVSADDPAPFGRTVEATRERIRRMNLLALELSQAFETGVADIDHYCALFGARALRTDYRLTGRSGMEAAAHVILWTLLSFGLDAWIPIELQERAKLALGGAQHVNVLRRRLQALGA